MLRQQPAAVRDKALGGRIQIGFERRDHWCQYALQACSIVHDNVPPGDAEVLARTLCSVTEAGGSTAGNAIVAKSWLGYKSVCSRASCSAQLMVDTILHATEAVRVDVAQPQGS
jgi:hypothetical protein